MPASAIHCVAIQPCLAGDRADIRWDRRHAHQATTVSAAVNGSGDQPPSYAGLGEEVDHREAGQRRRCRREPSRLRRCSRCRPALLTRALPQRRLRHPAPDPQGQQGRQHLIDKDSATRRAPVSRPPATPGRQARADADAAMHDTAALAACVGWPKLGDHRGAVTHSEPMASPTRKRMIASGWPVP